MLIENYINYNNYYKCLEKNLILQNLYHRIHSINLKGNTHNQRRVKVLIDKIGNFDKNRKIIE